MSYIFIGIVILSGWHFIYEGILLPSFRLELRYRLYTLRDKLRTLKAEEKDNISDEVFKSLHNSINNILDILPFMTIILVRRVNKEIDTNKDLQKKLQKQSELITSCKVKEVHSLKAEFIRITFFAIAYNSGGWFIYILPFAIIIGITLLIVNMITKCKKIIIELIFSIAFTPSHNLNKFVPTHDLIGRESFE